VKGVGRKPGRFLLTVRHYELFERIWTQLLLKININWTSELVSLTVNRPKYLPKEE